MTTLMQKEMEALDLQMVNNPNNNCGNCIYYNGEEEEEYQFCDVNETWVSSQGYCWRHTFRKPVEEEE